MLSLPSTDIPCDAVSYPRLRAGYKVQVVVECGDIQYFDVDCLILFSGDFMGFLDCSRKGDFGFWGTEITMLPFANVIIPKKIRDTGQMEGFS